MKRYFIARRAERDLAEIHAYISRDRPDAADRQADTFYRTIETIASQPLIGELRDAPAFFTVRATLGAIFRTANDE